MTDQAADTPGQLLLIDRPVDGIERIIFNRPDRLNAFTGPMYDQLFAALERIAMDPSIRVLVLSGAGRGFCSGNELSGGGSISGLPQHVGDVHRTRYNLMKVGRIAPLLRALPQPVVAAVNGPAAGLGFAIALAADIALAGESAKFVNAFHNVGTGHEFGVSYMLTQAVGSQRAAEILLTSHAMTGSEAAEARLVLRCVADEQLMEQTLSLARRMILNAPLDLWMTKQSMWASQSIGGLENAIEMEHRAVVIAQRTEDMAERRQAFVEKREAIFRNR